jgi:hypothetical protein
VDKKLNAWQNSAAKYLYRQRKLASVSLVHEERIPEHVSAYKAMDPLIFQLSFNYLNIWNMHLIVRNDEINVIEQTFVICA